MPNIHPTAIVDKCAEIDNDVVVGAYAIISVPQGCGIKIASGTKIGHHCYITGYTRIGKNNNLFPFCSIGTAAQDISYKDEPTELLIGDNNIFREFVTINTGTAKEEKKTIVGNNNFLMAYAHIGHDSVLGNNIIMANAVQLGGHVRIGNFAALGGLVGVHHFVTIGEHAFVAGAARVIQDIPPYVIAEGHPAKVRAINVIGLERRGFSKETITSLENAYKLIWRSKLTSSQAFQELLSMKERLPEEVVNLVNFLQNTQNGRFGRYRESLRKVPVR
jgi:UDP-N-acetylglucosamine acyltransferase